MKSSNYLILNAYVEDLPLQRRSAPAIFKTLNIYCIQ
jgi:hypothetical protein